MGKRLAATLLLATGMLVAAAPGTALAEDPVDLHGAYVLDTVGVISGDEQRVQDALDTLYDRARIKLFVVYVDSFTGTDDNDWANQTASRNGLGRDDILLAIAVGDRNYQVSVDNDFSLTDAQLTEVEDNYLIPQLRDDHWADAAIAAAQGYEAAATGVVGPNVPTTPDTPGTATGSPINPFWPILGGVVVVGAGAAVIVATRRRRKDDVAAPPEQLTQKQLDLRAGTLLVQLDDSVKTSEQELGFAIAQFGDDATKEFTATLASAKTKIADAFRIKKQLDDGTPETDAEKRTLTTQIISLCEAADAELDAQADAFDELRQLEKTAPDALTAVRASIADVTARAESAAQALTTLTDTYSAAAARPVADNPAQAAKLLTFAGANADAAEKALAAGTPAKAAIAVRSAQQAVGQATALFTAIDSLAANLADASAKLEAAVADTTQDIAAAKALETDANLSGAIAAAESALAAAAKAKADPVTSLAEVGKANAALEQVFTGVRDQQEQVQRARGQLDAAISAARTQISSAEEYITTRRGGIGDSARTRLSEADRHLAQAVAVGASDPVTALREAQQAADLANGAFRLAQSDVEASSPYRENLTSTGGNYDDGSDGADLGGILGALFGGGGGGGGYRSSGSSWGSSRSSSSWGGSRSSRSGSFGGSSRSSFRSSGGRSSHGGRF